MKKYHIVLLFISSVSLLLHIFLVPILQNPDETYHYATIETIMNSGILAEDALYSGYLIESIVDIGLPHIDAPGDREIFLENIGYEEMGDLPIYEICPSTGSYIYYSRPIIYQPFYYLLQSVVLRASNNIQILYSGGCDIVSSVYALRFFSAVITFISLIGVIRMSMILPLTTIGRKVFLGLIFFHPMFISVGTYINPDVLINLFSIYFLYYLVKFSKSGLAKDLNIKMLLIIIFVALFTKFTASIFIVWLLLFVLLSEKIKLFDRKILSILIGIVILMISYKIYYINNNTVPTFNIILYLQFIDDLSLKQSLDYIRETIVYSKQWHFRRFWGVWGWLQWYMPNWIYKLLWLISGLAIGGLLYRIYSNSLVNKSDNRILFIFSLVILSYVGIILRYDIVEWLYYSRVFIQGRYFMIIEVPIMFLMAYGLESVIKKIL